MLLLFKIALRHGRHFLLLGVTFSFMLLVSLSSNVEMMSVGVLTNSGSDFFTLFGEERDGVIESTSQVSHQQVEQRWGEISQGDSISKKDARSFMMKRKDRNPLNYVMAWLGERMLWSNDLSRLAILLIFVAIVKAASLFGSQFSKQLVMIRVARDLRERYFGHIHTLSMDFYQKYNVGNLVSRISLDAQSIAQGVNAALTTYVQTPIMVVSSLTVCLFLSLKLSLLIFLAFPAVILPILYFARRLKKVARRQQRLSEGSIATLVDLLSGIQTVKLFAREALSLAKYGSYNERQARLETKGARYGFLSRPVLHLASTFMLSGLILYGLYVAEMRVSEILVFCGTVYLMYEPIKRLNDENIHIQRGAAAAERMNEVLAMTPQVMDLPSAAEMTSFEGEIEFRDVWFRYEEQWILKGISFKIRKGESVALVGPTGGGKSTIVQLLPRLFEPQRGEILIDGKPLSHYTSDSLREQIAFVPQKPFLFMDTVAENIAFGRDYSEEEIETASKRAHAHEFIDLLPNRYQTQIAERGNSLSGGQQQRLAIARALVKNSPILVMDEATSALDAVSEAKIRQAVTELHGSVTQILIAHRLTTVEDVDRILYIENGQLVSEGPKEELLTKSPQFRSMWEAMFGVSELAEEPVSQSLATES
jgi:ABC-type multidrug transport system fused ATPase/permease subunit